MDDGKEHTGRLQKALLTLSNIWVWIKYILIFPFAVPAKETNPGIDQWLICQLKKNKKRMVIVAGEFGIGVNNKEVVEAFEIALKNGKKIDILCGPKIFHDPPDKQNLLFSYIRDAIRAKTYPNLNLHGVSLDNYPHYHFICNGRDVAIEKPHLPSQALSSDLKVYMISNSILWYKRLHLLFNNFKKKGVLPVEKLELATEAALKQFEDSPDFSGQKEIILSFAN